MYKKISFTLLLVAALSMAEAQRITKKVVLAKGQKIESVIVSNMLMSQEMMGQQMEIKMNAEATSLLEVNNVSSNAYSVTNTMKRIVVKSAVMGQEMNFDSDKPEDAEGQIGAAFKNKVGVAQGLEIDKQGRITAYKDTAASGDMVSSMMGGANIMVGSQHPLITILPGKAVKSGDSWVDSTGTPATYKTVNTYTLEKISGNDASININGTIEKSGIIEQQGMQVTMNLKGVVKGASVYDINTGILKNSNTETKMTGTMEVMGQTIPVNTTMTAVTTVNK